MVTLFHSLAFFLFQTSFLAVLLHSFYAFFDGFCRQLRAVRIDET
jgi:hypothetical protein